MGTTKAYLWIHMHLRFLLFDWRYISSLCVSSLTGSVSWTDLSSNSSSRPETQVWRKLHVPSLQLCNPRLSLIFDTVSPVRFRCPIYLPPVHVLMFTYTPLESPEIRWSAASCRPENHHWKPFLNHCLLFCVLCISCVLCIFSAF